MENSTPRSRLHAAVAEEAKTAAIRLGHLKALASTFARRAEEKKRSPIEEYMRSWNEGVRERPSRLDKLRSWLKRLYGHSA
jgi:GH24 family phage-related lysozyme (muramidase)